jgi:hypothetical protein
MNPGVLNPRAIFPAKFQALSTPEIAALQTGKLLLRFKEGFKRLLMEEYGVKMGPLYSRRLSQR